MRAVWSALTIAEADLETVWLVPHGKTLAERQFCARCAPTGRRGRSSAPVCGLDGVSVRYAPPDVTWRRRYVP
ncbi:hypothetical protein [Actinomadura terrae]|uniref:hypothetical protein n=1 Tax=Actinomadura terrae TaxID=604353 RepID=UPI001FA806BD|nr:hypothetical protein [Actinomadura terrae]